MERLLTKRNTIIFIGLLTLWRIYLAATLQLHPDEAYYWLWSRHLDLGYYDHSPLIAYFIRLTTLFSLSELWVRFSAILVSVILSALAWSLSLQLFGSVAVAAGSVLLLNSFPLTMSGSVIITPDIPSFLFWSLSVYLLWRIAATQKTRYWYLLGVSFGLSLLSKYTAILFAPSAFLFLLLTGERRWLKTVHPYLSFLIGLLFFLPVVYWNSLHDWISFRFQLGHGLGGAAYSPGKFFEYLGGQLLVIGPVVWITGMVAVIAFLCQKQKEKLLLSLTSLPVILFFGLSSFKAVAGPNWPAFAYFTFSIAASQFLLKGLKFRRFLWGASFLVSLSMSLLLTVHARFSVIPLARFSKDLAIADATNWFYGWRELCAKISEYPGTAFAITPSHQLSAEISYYTREKVYCYIDKQLTRPSQYNLWSFPDPLRDKRGLYLYLEGEAAGAYDTLFSSWEESGSLEIRRKGFPIRTYKIVSGKNYLPR